VRSTTGRLQFVERRGHAVVQKGKCVRKMAAGQFCWLVLLLLQHARALAAEVPSTGSLECPCIAPSSPLIAQATEQLAALGAPPGYGTSECLAHDKDLALSSCVGALEADCPGGDKCYCFEKWCYVDPSMCVMDKRKCLAAGGVVGQEGIVYCREREFTESTVIEERTGNTTAKAYYSYATCGGLNTYDTGKIFDVIAGRNLKIKITSSYYWTFKEAVDPRAPQWLGWTGVLNKALEDGFLRFSPTVNVTLDESWSTAISRTKFESSWTACVLDVAVGNADMCIGDFWITPQRMNLANFLTPFGNDNFYLIAPSGVEDESILTTLQKPFLPFSDDLWMVTMFFLLFSAAVMMITDGHNMDDYNNQSFTSKVWKSLYFSFAGYVQGGSANLPASVPGRLATIGFGFFVLITLASYTANLATILVTKGSATGLTSAQDAVDKGITICVPMVVEAQLRSNFPTAKFELLTASEDTPRALFQGLCGAAILQETGIETMHAGGYNIRDCAAADAGVFKDDTEAHCVRDENGIPTTDRDCWIVKAGGLIMSVPLSVPVRTDLVQSLGWAMRKTLSDGKVDVFKATFAQTLPPPACTGDGLSLTAAQENPLDSLRLPVTAMLGTTLISIGIMLLALVLSGIEVWTGKTIQQLLGCSREEDIPFATSDNGKPGSRRALLPSAGTRRDLRSGNQPGNLGGSALAQQQIQKLDDVHRMLKKICGEQDFDVNGGGGDNMKQSARVVPLGSSPMEGYSSAPATGSANGHANGHAKC